MADHFFIVGAQRCGTTYLYELLDAHPQIEMARPLHPEPKFFLRDPLYERGIGYYEVQYFGRQKRDAVRGEKSTSYIESPVVAERIKQNYPDAKIIMIFRDPIERAASHYWFSVSHGAERLAMEEAFRREPQRREEYEAERFSVSPYAYLQRGCYVGYLGMWRRLFGLEQIFVLIMERFVGCLRCVQDLYDYLGVDSRFTPPGLDQKINSAERGADNLTSDLRSYLLDYFREPTARLAAELNDSLEEWAWR